MAEGGSKTELQFLRKELANQLEECTRTHNLYRMSNELEEEPSDEWIIQLRHRNLVRTHRRINPHGQSTVISRAQHSKFIRPKQAKHPEIFVLA
jgi:3-methyladenine DNA glycosylase AlkC